MKTQTTLSKIISTFHTSKRSVKNFGTDCGFVEEGIKYTFKCDKHYNDFWNKAKEANLQSQISVFDNCSLYVVLSK